MQTELALLCGAVVLGLSRVKSRTWRRRVVALGLPSILSLWAVLRWMYRLRRRLRASGRSGKPLERKVDVEHVTETVQVRTSKGDIRGYVSCAPCSGGTRPCYNFRGVPYAQPPVGEDRFMHPKEHKAWSHVRDCFDSLR